MDNEVTAAGFDDGEENISVAVPRFCTKRALKAD